MSSRPRLASPSSTATPTAPASSSATSTGGRRRRPFNPELFAQDRESYLQLPFQALIPIWERESQGGRSPEGIRQLCLADRFYLLVNVLHRRDVVHPWVFARCREVELATDGHIDLWAREHYKSTIITFAGIIQEILRDPEITVSIFSHTKAIAKGFLGQIKLELETNDLLQRCFPDIFWAKPQAESPSWSEDGGIIVKRVGNPKEASVEAWGLVDGQPTSKHFSLMVFDDVVTEKSVNTPEQIQKTTEAWSLADNLGTQAGRKWHVGTRFHYADTYAEIIKRGAAVARIHPATHDGTLEGRPVLLSVEVWERKKRDQLETTVACQLLLNPLAGHQRMFDVSNLRVYEARPETLMVYIMVDPARSKRKGSDNTAMAVVGIDYTGAKYLLDGYAHKMDLMERWQKMRDLWRKWRQQPGIVGLAVGYERYGAIADLDYFNERKLAEEIDFDIVELEWPNEGPGSKIDRVQRLTPDIKGHKFFIPYPTNEEELTPTQVRMIAGGYEYRVAQKILRRNENGQQYDLAEQFKTEVHFFPFGGLKDLIDAVSRIYDMDPRPPEHIDSRVLEPEVV